MRESSAPHPWTRAAPVFRPTDEEFADFAAYIAKIEPECAESGICKIVPPPSWRGPRAPPQPSGYMLKSPIQQHVISNCAGLYQLLNQERPRISLERFGRQAMAAAEKAGLAALDEAAAVDAFWSGVATAKPPLYAADIDDSLFPPANELDAWNLRALPDLLRKGPTALRERLPGVNTPMLYYGQWRSTFTLHVEDMDLFSINCAPPPPRNSRRAIRRAIFPRNFAQFSDARNPPSQTCTRARRSSGWAARSGTPT